MHTSNADQIGATAAVELFQIGKVLEEVGIQAFFGNLYVGLHVVGEDVNIQINAFFSQCWFDELKNLGVRHGSSSD